MRGAQTSDAYADSRRKNEKCRLLVIAITLLSDHRVRRKGEWEGRCRSPREVIFWQCAEAGLVYVGCDVGGSSYPATIAGLDAGGECAGRIGAGPLVFAWPRRFSAGVPRPESQRPHPIDTSAPLPNGM